MQFHSQKRQDRWIVGEALPGRRGGYFVDLAAADGVELNNTLVLEREFGWTGVAIEANSTFYAELAGRRTCRCVQACIDEEPGEVTFLANGVLGGIVDDDTDNSPLRRRGLIDEWGTAGTLETIPTRTLADLLDEVGAPAVIDYLSLDVEGAETRILRRFPFHRYTFLAATIERPTPELNALLFANGYLFVRNQRNDTFYVHHSAPTADMIAREPFEQVPPKEG